MKKFLLVLITFVAVLLAPLYLHTVFNAQRAFDRAEALRLSDSRAEQILLYGEAASWLSPFNGSAKQALVELRQISDDQELDTAIRLQALEQERRAISKTRNWINELFGSSAQPRLKEILESERELRAIDEFEGVSEASPLSIRFGAQILSHIFFLLWVSLVVLAILSGFRKDGTVRGKPLMKMSGLAAGCFALWVSSLLFA